LDHLEIITTQDRAKGVMVLSFIGVGKKSCCSRLLPAAYSDEVGRRRPSYASCIPCTMVQIQQRGFWGEILQWRVLQFIVCVEGRLRQAPTLVCWYIAFFVEGSLMWDPIVVCSTPHISLEDACQLLDKRARGVPASRTHETWSTSMLWCPFSWIGRPDFLSLACSSAGLGGHLHWGPLALSPPLGEAIAWRTNCFLHMQGFLYA
jgi:hypothetical protein